jgi:hypothetical protein
MVGMFCVRNARRVQTWRSSSTTAEAFCSSILDQGKASANTMGQNGDGRAIESVGKKVRDCAAGLSLRWSSLIAVLFVFIRSPSYNTQSSTDLRTFSAELRDNTSPNSICCGTFVKQGQKTLLATSGLVGTIDVSKTKIFTRCSRLTGLEQLWDLCTGSCERLTHGHRENVNALACAHVRKSLMASISSDKLLVSAVLLLRPSLMSILDLGPWFCEPFESVRRGRDWQIYLWIPKLGDRSPWRSGLDRHSGCLSHYSGNASYDTLYHTSCKSTLQVWELRAAPDLHPLHNFHWAVGTPIQHLEYIINRSGSCFIVTSVRNLNPPIVKVRWCNQ